MRPAVVAAKIRVAAEIPMGVEILVVQTPLVVLAVGIQVEGARIVVGAAVAVVPVRGVVEAVVAGRMASFLA